MGQEGKWLSVPKNLFSGKGEGKIFKNYQEFSSTYKIHDPNFHRMFERNFRVPPKDTEIERKKEKQKIEKAKFAQYRANSRFPIDLGKRERVVWPEEYMDKKAEPKKRLRNLEKEQLTVDNFTPKEDEIDFDELDKMLL